MFARRNVRQKIHVEIMGFASHVARLHRHAIPPWHQSPRLCRPMRFAMPETHAARGGACQGGILNRRGDSRWRLVEAGGVEPPSETKSPQHLRAYPLIESRPSGCPRAGHLMRQRPRRCRMPTRSHGGMPACCMTLPRSADIGGSASWLIKPREPIQSWRFVFSGHCRVYRSPRRATEAPTVPSKPCRPHSGP